MSSGKAGLRDGSTLEVRERAGSGCGRRGPPLCGLRLTRPGPAVGRVHRPRLRGAVGGVELARPARPYNCEISRRAFAPALPRALSFFLSSLLRPRGLRRSSEFVLQAVAIDDGRPGARVGRVAIVEWRDSSMSPSRWRMLSHLSATFGLSWSARLARCLPTSGLGTALLRRA
jgi:hypothetical protein